MASTRLIETLIVKLGLDPAGFTKGQKQAAAAAVQTEDTVKKSSEAQSGYLGKLTAKWLTVAGAVWALKKAVSTIDDVAERTRRLGIDSKNYDMAAASLRNFENAVQMFGGNTEEARKTVDGFNKSLFNLAYQGQMDQSLIMLARLGVQFETATGDARDFKSVVLDTADAIAAAQDQGMSRANAFQYLQQAGFDAGTSQMILAGRAQAEAALAAQEKRRQVSDTDTAAATGIIQSRTGMRQAREGLEIEFMQSEVGKKLEAVRNAAEDAMTPSGMEEARQKAISKTVEGMEKLAEVVNKVGAAFGDLVAKSAPKGRAAYESVIQRAAAANNIPADMLAAVLKTESGFDPAAVNKKSGARGIAQLMQSSFPDREVGVNPDDDIRTAAAYLADLKQQAGGNWDLALQMYNAGPTRMRNAGKPGAKPLAQETLDYPGKVFNNMEDSAFPASATPTPAAQTGATYNKTDVQIDSITVNTQAKDAAGVANGMDAAVKRKLLASHAEQGMQ